jgi:hypothetical protein
MTEEQLKNKYDSLLKDTDFDRLELGLKNPNIFQILRISNNEIRHSNFLIWLLSPNESHGLGDIFLKRFLREVFSSDKFSDIDQTDVEGLDLRKVNVLREWKNIDILIQMEDVVVCIENKVLTKEHSNQLSRYRNIIEQSYPNSRKTFVYLNPDGDSSVSESELYHPMSFGFIVETLERIISIYGDSVTPQVVHYIKDYITIIKRDLMRTDELTELSKKIYSNHKELFDFIIERKPDGTDEVTSIFERLILEKGWILTSPSRGYVRFITSKLQPLVYTNKSKNGFKDRTSFVFEFYLSTKTNVIQTDTVISVSDKSFNTQRLVEILKEIKQFDEPKGTTWISHYYKKYKFNFEDVYTLSNEEVESRLTKVLDGFQSIVEKVEEKYLEYENEIRRMNDV